jgi:hypothetical protein
MDVLIYRTILVLAPGNAYCCWGMYGIGLPGYPPGTAYVPGYMAMFGYGIVTFPALGYGIVKFPGMAGMGCKANWPYAGYTVEKKKARVRVYVHVCMCMKREYLCVCVHLHLRCRCRLPAGLPAGIGRSW